MLSRENVTREALSALEAQRAANVYIRRNSAVSRTLRRIPAPLFTAAGAAAMGLAWLVVTLFF